MLCCLAHLLHDRRRRRHLDWGGRNHRRRALLLVDRRGAARVSDRRRTRRGSRLRWRYRRRDPLPLRDWLKLRLQVWRNRMRRSRRPWRGCHRRPRYYARRLCALGLLLRLLLLDVLHWKRGRSGHRSGRRHTGLGRVVELDRWRDRGGGRGGRGGMCR